jgi:hypothetical protein
VVVVVHPISATPTALYCSRIYFSAQSKTVVSDFSLRSHEAGGRKLLARSQTLWSIGEENGENVKVSFHLVLVLAASQFLMLFFAPSVLQNSLTNSNSTAKEVPMSTRATGTFEVKLVPLPTHDSSEGSPVGSMAIDQQIHGGPSRAR